MKSFTLFIDESGDFKNKSTEWIIGGILFENDYQSVKKILDIKLSNLIKKFKFNSIHDFHLTELRSRFGHEKAVQYAKLLFSELEMFCDFKLFSVINEYKNTLNNSENTYRAMVADMLYLIDNVNITEIEKLDLVIATRTINGIRTTTESDIQYDIIEKLPQSFVFDLSSIGLYSIVSKNKINIIMDCASKNWGLVCADFLSNLVYHRSKKNESELISIFKQKNLYHDFVAFGSYDVRRARIAYINGDLILSIFRWLIIAVTDSKYKYMAREEINLIFIKMQSRTYSSEAKYSLESIIERIWRNIIDNKTKEEIYILLLYYIKKYYKYNQLHVIIHINNILLIIYTRNANVEKSEIIINEQNLYIQKAISRPECFHAVLDYKRIIVEYYVNNIDLQNALRIAQEYEKIVDTYFELMEVVEFDSNKENIINSELWIKKELFVLRIFSLCNIFVSDKIIENISNRIDLLKTIEMKQSDISRLFGIEIIYCLYSKRYNHGIESINNYISNKEISKFDVFWILIFLNFSKNHINQYSDMLKKFEKYVLNFINSVDMYKNEYPNTIIWRELGIYFWLNYKDKSRSLQYLRRSKNLHNLSEANISKLQINIINNWTNYIQKNIQILEKDIFDYKRLLS